jgi:hypothetical protein
MLCGYPISLSGAVSSRKAFRGMNGRETTNSAAWITFTGSHPSDPKRAPHRYPKHAFDHSHSTSTHWVYGPFCAAISAIQAPYAEEPTEDAL